METDESFREETDQPAGAQHLTISYAVGMMLLMIVLQLLLSLLFSKFKGAVWEETSWVNIALTHGISGLLTAQAGAILAGLSLITLVVAGDWKPSLLVPLLAATLGITILASELGNVMNWISPVSDDYVAVMNKLFEQNVFGVLFSVGLLAPVVEELIFRGVILQGLQVAYSRHRAIVISSLLFALIHVYPWAVINAFLLGLAFAWLREETGSIVPCIIAHSIYNSLPFLLIHFTSIEIQGFTTMPGSEVQFQPLWFDIAGVLLVIAGCLGIRAVCGESSESGVQSPFPDSSL